MGLQIEIPEQHKLAVAAAQGELDALLTKYNVRLAVLELKVDGQVKQLSVQIIPNGSTMHN